MKYKYPKISNYLIYKKCAAGHVEVTDFFSDDVFVMEAEEAKYIRRLDGKTDPYRIRTELARKEIDCILADLYYYDLLKESNKSYDDGGTVMRSIWEPRMTGRLRDVAYVCNGFLLISWLPALVAGIVMFKNSILGMGFDMMWLGSIIGLIFGVLLHEFGHAFAGVSYGAKVFEMGVMRMYHIVPGGYVLMDDKRVKSRLQRVQIAAAGVEANLLLAGVLLMLAAVFKSIGGILFMAALQNMFLSVFNLTFTGGLDGAAIISELLGIEDIVEKAKAVVADRDKRRMIKERGLTGHATVAACCIIFCIQVAMPIVVVLNGLEVLTWLI